MYDKNIVIRTRTSKEMRDEFKAICEMNDVSMSDVLRKWITDYVTNYKKNQAWNQYSDFVRALHETGDKDFAEYCLNRLKEDLEG